MTGSKPIAWVVCATRQHIRQKLVIVAIANIVKSDIAPVLAKNVRNIMLFQPKENRSMTTQVHS